MSEVAIVVVVYLGTVACALVGALFGWAMNYLDGNLRDARACLVFVPWAPIWPVRAARALGRAIQETLDWNRR